MLKRILLLTATLIALSGGSAPADKGLDLSEAWQRQLVLQIPSSVLQAHMVVVGR